MGSRTLGSPSVLKRKAKCPFPRGLVAGGSSYALLFRLVSRPLCLRVLPLCRASTRCSRCSAYGRGEGGENIFFPNFSPLPFRSMGEFVEGWEIWFDNFFFLFLFLLFERIFRWNFDIFGKNFGIFLIVRSDFVDSKLVRGECFAETEIDRNISILL